MNILARTMAAFLATAPAIFSGSGIVVDSLGVPVRDALVTRRSDGATVSTGSDGSWIFAEASGVTRRSVGRKDRDMRLVLLSNRLLLLAGGHRDAAGRGASFGSGDRAVVREAHAARSAAAKDSVSVVAPGWRSARTVYDSASRGHRTVLQLAPSPGMVAVQGGFGSMGSVAIANNKPHVARVAGFWIDTVEVTQKLYDSLMKQNPSYHENCAKCPVEQVSWFDAVRFCNARSRAEGLPEVYDISESDSLLWSWDPKSPGFRLPTETEWEYAARAGSSSDWYWGPYINKETVVQYAWYDQNAEGSTQPVGQLKPNDLGLYDVSGNVSEWTNDWFSDLGGDTLIYPKGPSTVQEWRTLRGGDMESQNTAIISTIRLPCISSTRWLATGFRCARGVMP